MTENHVKRPDYHLAENVKLKPLVVPQISTDAATNQGIIDYIGTWVSKIVAGAEVNTCWVP